MHLREYDSFCLWLSVPRISQRGAVLIAIEAGAKDTDPAPGAATEARTASHREVRQRETRPDLILAAVVARGTVGEAGAALGGERGVSAG